MSWVFINGEVIEDNEAHISVFDHGLVTGDGAFEALAVYDGVPFALTRHLQRLAKTVQGMRLPIPDLDYIRQGVIQTIEANPCPTAKLRITYTAGRAGLSSDRAGAEPMVIVAMTAQEFEQKKGTLALAPWPRNERGVLAGLKTTSYAENVIGLDWAKSEGADEVLFANLAGNLCEGSGSNIFLVLRGRIVTPPLSAGCLAGVTRDLVLEITDAVEEDVEVGAMYSDDCEEVFITSTLRDIQGIERIDQRKFVECPGSATQRVFAAFEDLRSNDMDP